LQRELRELEEQMQSDDRVERLENSLKNMQDRADELEFQLSKLKSVNITYYFHYCACCDGP
jgi:DNA repair ATPase RecN